MILSCLDHLEKRLEGVRRVEDVEDIHQLRVACRRLRSALPAFRKCFPKKDLARWTGEIKSLAASLGRARDTDVQILHLEELLRSPEGVGMRRGLEFLLRQHRELRLALQPGVVDGVATALAGGVLGELRGACWERLGSGTRADDHYRSPATRLASQQGIRKALAGLLAQADCVDDRKNVEGHHEMRIAAKRLRYILEHFASLYRSRLRPEISAVKRLQEILGRIHDLDVWAAGIPVVLREHKDALREDPRLAQDLDALLTLTMEQRDKAFERVTAFWRGDRMAEAIASLREKSSDALILPPESFQRIAIVADLHGNLEATRAVIADAGKRGAKLLLCAGDLVGGGPAPEEVVRALQEAGAVAISGENDLEALLFKRRDGQVRDAEEAARVYTRTQLSKASRKHLASLSGLVRLSIGGTVVLAVHGHPDDGDPALAAGEGATAAGRRAGGPPALVLVSAHTHLGRIRKHGRRISCNPGSVGQPVDGDSRASYALLQLRPLGVKLIRVTYPVEDTAHDMRRAGLPEILAQQVLAARPLEELEARDRACLLLGREERLSRVREVSEGCLGRDRHTAKVAEHAGRVFDLLESLHRMGPTERLLLECAAWLHDTGWSSPEAGHQKRSMATTLNDQALPFTSEERRLVGSVVRYHTGSVKEHHFHYAGLKPFQRQAVQILSSLLRIADALDASHTATSEVRDASCGPSQVILVCAADADHRVEQEAFERKKDVFEATFGRKIRLRWVSPVRGRADSSPEG